MISIIIPTYNAEAYLAACLDSLLRQTVQDLQIILVDDGCTDNSLATAQAYAAKDSRIEVYLQAHAGQSAARNNGLKHATGEFIAFVDADDTIAPDWCEQHLAAIEGVAYVQSGYERNGKRFLPKHRYQFTSPCMRLYRKETIDFAGLCISLDALDADGTHTRLRLHVHHPETWTQLQSQNMNGWFLHFPVLLDGEQAPFVLKAKSVQLGFDTQNERCDDYVIVLESDAVNMHTLAAYRTLTVLPFVLTPEWRAVGNHWRTDPDGTDVATTLTRPHFALGPRRTDLSALALSVDLAAVCSGIEPQPIPQREPLTRTVTIFHEDIQRNLDEECYTREGENIPMYGYYENVTADFSGIRIYVDQFQVTDLNILMLARIELPEEWTPEQTWLFGRRPLDFYFLIDGNNAAGRAFYGIRDFTMHSYPGLHRIPTSVDDPENFSVKTLYCMIYASRQYADAILNANELCIVPVLRHDQKLRVHGKVYDLDREPTPYDANLTYDVLEWSRDPVWELAVYIDPGTLIVSKEVD